MANNLLATSTDNLRSILSNGKHYTVPAYQRNYSWDEEQWEDLWEDMLEVEKSGRQHYLGALVLTAQKTDDFKIIDGQQRLATLSIFIIAALQCLGELISQGHQPEENQQRADLIRSAFLGSTNPSTLRTTPKLTLNSANRLFYEGTLLTLQHPKSIGGLKPTERTLWDATEFFRAKLSEKFVSNQDGEGLATFVYETIATNFLFILVIVEDEAGAYTVFETLNARGLELTSGDLLKNYLLSVIHPSGESDLNQAIELWDAISNRVHPKRVPEFLRHCLNSRQAYVRQERVYKTVRAEITTAKKAFDFLEELQNASLLVEALGDPSHGLWTEIPGSKQHIRNLKLYGVVQYRPLVIAAWRRFEKTELVKILKACDVISFRYTTIAQRNSNALEFAYNKVSVAIETGVLPDARAAVDAIKSEIYLSDDDFREAFGRRSMPTGQKTRLVRYILFALEKQLYGTDLDWEETPATIEHILPENPSGQWLANFPGDLHDRYVDRLGNYLPLESKLNSREAADKYVTEKIPVYAKSQYEMTKNFDVGDWTPTTIDQRQDRLAKTATAVWKL